uniref:Cupin domain-containing protein n=1 Tax=Roseihalotalea indica TaxID=2867963 RepID=A0AA49GQI7_9BACT|nr:cupin domain-containing protein [Tunicatimonas sp. TK19036]
MNDTLTDNDSLKQIDMQEHRISPTNALHHLSQQSAEFATLFEHGTLSVEIYKPDSVDRQQPHERDEIYVVIAGKGDFYNDGKTTPFAPGDFLFVPAGVEHRFLNFTEDFATWVFFYGPSGGELPKKPGTES